ncbi:MAG: S9 family peptidase, partial [Bacteroidota bacterium]
MKENPPDQQLPGDPSLPSSPEAISALSEHIPSDLSYAVEDFFRLPEQIAFQLSPSGEYIAFLAPYERRNNIHVRRLDEEEAVRITSETDRSISSFFWASDDRIVFVKDSVGNENYQLFAVNKDCENARDSTP